jgi:hypothetical protein
MAPNFVLPPSPPGTVYVAPASLTLDGVMKVNTQSIIPTFMTDFSLNDFDMIYLQIIKNLIYRNIRDSSAV